MGGPGADPGRPKFSKKRNKMHEIMKIFGHGRVGCAPPRSATEVPYRSNFFHFHVVFWEKWPNKNFTCPPFELEIPLGNPGSVKIAHKIINVFCSAAGTYPYVGS